MRRWKRDREKPSGEGSSSQAVQHLEPESFFEEKSLGKEATESLGRRKLKDPLKRWVKRTPRGRGTGKAWASRTLTTSTIPTPAHLGKTGRGSLLVALAKFCTKSGG